MLAKQHFSTEQAREFGDKLGIDWDWSCSNDDQLLIEFGIELECELNATFADETEKLPLSRWNRDRSSQHQYRARHTVRISEEECFVS
jgi:hypothetical protein